MGFRPQAGSCPFRQNRSLRARVRLHDQARHHHRAVVRQRYTLSGLRRSCPRGLGHVIGLPGRSGRRAAWRVAVASWGVSERRRAGLTSVSVKVLEERAMSDCLVVAYGAGVDSTAMLIGLRQRDVRPDAILFGDTGGEKEETYAFLPVMDGWLRDQDFPTVTRSEEHTSELQSRGLISYAVFCLKN